nr:DUF4230 domain-containing protein [uncultured Oscillibacter sp.]
MELQEKRREETPKKRGWLTGLLYWHLLPRVLGILVVILLAAAVALGAKTVLSADGRTARLGFEDIGELATQSAYCTEVEVTEASRELFGVTIPFTQSKYIYSYDVVIKAGLDFTDVSWSQQDGTIRVTLPEIRVLSNEIDLDSLKVYHEDESLFRNITLEENNAALADLKARAEQDAIGNGLLEEARDNAQQILTAFFANQYDLTEYRLEFTGG